ncbi:MAG: hypothetical protein ABSE46_25060 [Terracidiphilus sp.]|jgi:hypothetical protein
MKKLVFASLIALVSISLVNAPALRAQAAQDSGQISLPADQYNAYQNATTQSDPKAKAAALETFLTTYPQTPVKKDILTQLLGAYQQVGDTDNMLNAATRLLQVDPSNFQAIFVSAYVKKLQCAKSVDANTGQSSSPQTCDDAAALAQKGLAAQKPAGVSDDEWKKMSGAAFPIFHSTIAADDSYVKKDYKAAENEYKAELMLYTDAQSQSTGLPDTLLLAQDYSLIGAGQDLIQAIWFYARVWDFAPPAYKAQIEPKLEYYLKKYHGKLDVLDAIKAQAQATTFPPASFTISPAPTAQEQIHTMLTDPSISLPNLALSDKETILAFGTKDDAEKVWAVMKDQQTPVPGIVIEASATVIKVAVTQDAKDAKIPDFIVTLKTPLADKDIPAVGFEYGLSSKGQAELDGTYDSYTQIPAKDAVPATATTPAIPATAQSAQIAVRDGFIQEKKKAAPVHKPAAGHKPAAAH